MLNTIKAYSLKTAYALTGNKATIKRSRKVKSRGYTVEVMENFVAIHTGLNSAYYLKKDAKRPMHNLYRIIANGVKGNDFVIHCAKTY